MSTHTGAVAAPATATAVPMTADRRVAWLLTVCGALGLAASGVLTVDKLRLLQDPSYVPSCNINPVISCGSVMRTDQASAFGVPNSLFGLAAFAVVLATGVGLFAGAGYRRWYWTGLQLGSLAGVGTVVWLADQALYEIGALCPYCLVVWAVVLPLAWYLSLHNSARLRRLVGSYHWTVPLLWYTVLTLLVLTRFWSYWRTLLP
ncbi:vitamin K epoxide reductase family protein [Kitasatospora sp. NPDC096147]|uniref:vitamin K epoxide reductase family protein n=1 Tax=Kitasatospora sp. NPDC096147 TaxID=3364093 RepID=UPI00382FE204